VSPSEALRSPQSLPENKDPPTGRCKAGLLAHSSRNAFPVQRPVAKRVLRQSTEHTAAGTAAELHGIPI